MTTRIDSLRLTEKTNILNEISLLETEVVRLEKSFETLKTSEIIKDSVFKSKQLAENTLKIQETNGLIQEKRERLLGVVDGVLDEELLEKSNDILQAATLGIKKKAAKVVADTLVKKDQREKLNKYYKSERQGNWEVRTSERDMAKAYDYWSKIKFPDLSGWPSNRGKIIHPRYSNGRFDCTTYCWGGGPPEGPEFPCIMYEETRNYEIKHVIYKGNIEYYKRTGRDSWEFLESVDRMKL